MASPTVSNNRVSTAGFMGIIGSDRTSAQVQRWVYQASTPQLPPAGIAPGDAPARPWSKP